jgi:hypothetical protein
MGPKGQIYMMKYVFVVLMNFPYSLRPISNTSKDNFTIHRCKEKKGMRGQLLLQQNDNGHIKDPSSNIK